jgi:putative endonuclease
VADWSVYLLRCGDGTLYTGIATDVERRLAEHVAGRGARYTRGRGPLVLLGARVVGTRSEALREEARIKALDRARKLAVFPDYTPAGNSSPGSGTPSASSGTAENEQTAESGSGA